MIKVKTNKMDNEIVKIVTVILVVVMMMMMKNSVEVMKSLFFKS